MKSLFGGILLAVGILVAGVSGLCSLVFVVTGLGDLGGILPLILMFGGVPFLVGLGLYFAGRSLVRSARREQEGRASPGSDGVGES